MKVHLLIEIRHGRRAPGEAEVALAVENGDTRGEGWEVVSARPSVERVTNRVPAGYISMDECRRLASTYDGGEGHHPLARHRDSMG